MVDELPFTHKVTLTLTSNNNAPDVEVQVKWDPDMEGVDVVALGYLPPAFQFAQEYILPALTEAFLYNEYGELMEIESPSERLN